MTEAFYRKADLALADHTLPGRHARQCSATAQAIAARLAGVGLKIAAASAPALRGTLRELWFFRLEDGREIVVRLADEDAASVGCSGAAEALVLKTLEGRHLPTPAALAFLPREGRQPACLVTRYQPGEALSALDGDDAAFARYIPATARALRAVHSLGGKGFGLVSASKAGVLRGPFPTWLHYLQFRLAEHLQFLLNHDIVTPVQQQHIRALFVQHAPALAQAPACLLHGDCGSHNVIVAPDKAQISLIDWEDALIGDPLFDIASWASFQPQRRWPAFFAAYFESPWHPNQLFWLYFLRIALAKMVHRLRFGYPDLPGRTPARQRIDDALLALEKEEGVCPP